MHQVLIDGISSNMASLEHTGKYGEFDAVDPKILVYYAVKCLSEPFTLQEEKITYVQVSKAVEMLIISEYIITIKEKKCY